MRTATRVKVCCIATVDEMRAAVHAGASAVGLVAEMPSGPGVIDDREIRRIASATPAGVSTFLLTSRTTARAIIDEHARCATSVIQLADWVEPGEREILRKQLPAVRLVQVLHVADRSVIDRVPDAAAWSSAILLDSGNADLVVKELGGTGRVHDWSVSAEIVAGSPLPVFLAGGLTPENVGEAIARVRPFGVDLCTGIRTGGALDPVRLGDFVSAVRSADAAAATGPS